MRVNKPQRHRCYATCWTIDHGSRTADLLSSVTVQSQYRLYESLPAENHVSDVFFIGSFVD